MGLSSIVRSKGFKNMMAKMYGIGAAIVILGALFKIQHYPGAGLMLIVGLLTEAIIFFFSAFEPPHVEPDWSLVYPELAGMYDGYTDPELDGMIEGSKGTPTEELDKMLEEAKIGPELIESLGSGLRNLSESASQMSDMASATVATNQYTESLSQASQNLSALNSVYELQLQHSNQQTETFSKMDETMDKFLANLQGSIENTEKYKTQADELAKNVASLNQVYGNMLNAMNVQR